MPPKKQDNKPKKTFGLKNKNKSSKVQKQVQIIQQQESQKGRNKELKEKEKEKQALQERKRAEQAKKELEASLYTGPEIVQPKVPFGVDPKTVVCAYFKAGRCQKGNKCKFSHNLEAERKTQKASLYADKRDEGKDGSEKKEDDMSTWTEEQLRDAVSRKGNLKATTDIICKFFLDAVESQKYGWFWECPNGPSCMYRHALPPGFVLKSQKKKSEDDAKKNEISLEEFLEVERHKLDQAKLTPITKDSFAEWKKNRVSKKEAEAQAMNSAKSATAQAGKLSGLSGRDLFTYNPELLLGDEDEDEEGGDDEWDFAMLRVRTENERQAKETERLRAMDSSYGQMSLNDSSSAAAAAEAAPPPAEGDGDAEA
ncbi:Translation machinery-associated protein 46 [Rhodotorula sphaerocarpa]